MLPSLLLLLSLLSPPGTRPGDLTGWTAHPLIAHAFGGVDGVDLTNSREAFEASYAKGFRVFEADLMLTKDRKHLVARHDWDKKQFMKFRQDQYIPDLQEWNPLSLQEYLELPILNRYNGMDWPQMLNLLVERPDIYFVLDTKHSDENTVKTQFRLVVDEAVRIDPALLNRIIPQLYNRTMLETVDSIHPFPSYIYTLYQTNDTNRQIVDFVRSNPRIDAVAMAAGRVSKSFIQSLNDLGLRTYVHTINDQRTYQKYRESGVFGIYTDFIGYADLLKSKRGKWTAKPPLPTDPE